MPIRAIARLIQTMLYARRFFPYYVYNILGGIEEDGMFNHYKFSVVCLRHQFKSLQITHMLGYFLPFCSDSWR